jgi:hypothetical protein
MGGRLPLTMRVASIGSWGSAGTPKTRQLEQRISRRWHCRKRPCREPSPALSRLGSLARFGGENSFSAKALAAGAIPVDLSAQIAARRMNLSAG